MLGAPVGVFAVVVGAVEFAASITANASNNTACPNVIFETDIFFPVISSDGLSDLFKSNYFFTIFPPLTVFCNCFLAFAFDYCRSFTIEMMKQTETAMHSMFEFRIYATLNQFKSISRGQGAVAPPNSSCPRFLTIFRTMFWPKFGLLSPKS